MRLQIKANGVDELRRKVANVAECAVAGTLTRRGLSDVGRIVTRAQKNMAPVRKGRILQRKLDKRLQKGMAVGKATRLSTVPINRVQKLDPDFIGPPRLRKPGLIKRSIGYRVLKQSSGSDATFVVKMGMNVGKKRSHQNYAPHRMLVAFGTKERFTNGKLTGKEMGPKRGASRGRMPKNQFIHHATQFAAASAIAALDKAVKEDTVRAYRLSLRASRVVS